MKYQMSLPAAALAALCLCGPAQAQQTTARYGNMPVQPGPIVPGVGQILVPRSSLKQPGDAGRRAHTNHMIMRPTAPSAPPRPGKLARQDVPASAKIETPASMACLYRLVTQAQGCDPDRFFTVASGGSRVIAIVDAFHNATAPADLKTFSAEFGLPPPNLQVVYCSATTCDNVTTPPDADAGWALEIALDTQWAHSMAPHAKLVLVESFSNTFDDLMRAIDKARSLVRAAGGGEVSQSYGSEEFSESKTLDGHFNFPKVVFFASTGDVPGTEYPSTSPYVVAVGGTTILRNSSGAFVAEAAWSGTGGGLSSIYTRPAFQRSVTARVANRRGVPDISANADPASGVWVYCSVSSCGAGPWFIVGGTSVSAPVLAGITNNAASFLGSSDAQLTEIYRGLGTRVFNDVAKGACSNGVQFAAVKSITGWDACTGVGTPRGRNGL